MPDSKRRLGAVDLILPALLVTLQLSLFGPHTIYSGNEAEFTAPFSGLGRHLVLPALLLFVTLTGLGAVLSGGWRRGYVALLFSVGILLWAQANLLVANYGPLDGNAIDWSAHDWRNKYELALWVIVPMLAVIGARTIAPAAVFGSGVLVALQLALLVASSLQADSRTRAEWRGPFGRNVRGLENDRTCFTSSSTDFIRTCSPRFSQASAR